MLDSLPLQKETPALVEEQPFYKDVDYEDMEELDGGDITIDYRYEGYDGVRCVLVEFCGAPPAGWKDFSYGEYQEDNWKNLTQEQRETLAARLADAICREKVESLSLSFEPWGEEMFLGGEFAPGWAALWYDDMENGVSYMSHNTDYDTVEELCPIEIGGQSPVAKKWALEDLDLAARIVEYLDRKSVV